MRHFRYFLYDCYDPSQVSSPADDPRLVLNGDADEVLSAVIDAPSCDYDALCRQFAQDTVDGLVHIGLLCSDGKHISPGCPVFIKEDAGHLRSCFSGYVSRMAESLLLRKAEFYRLAEEIGNGFSPETNLYHLLCGAILDGDFFEILCSRSIVATSHVHPSGLDYLIIVYEKCPELDELSSKLLCSYNRFTDGERALQSFGDADGERVDFFRFSMQKRKGTVPERLQHIERLWDRLESHRELILKEVQQLVETGECNDLCQQLLAEFGYLCNGKIAVPIYTSAHLPIIQKLGHLTEQCILSEMEAALTAPSVILPLHCMQSGIPAGEAANELYHLVFGQLNELLVQKKFVTEPSAYPGEGRYLKSIELLNL